MDNCIYCTQPFSAARPQSREDIIPRFLGGFWRPPIACQQCNSTLGATTDAAWQRNHEAVRALSELGMPIDPNVFRQRRRQPTEPGQRPQYELVGYGKTRVPFSIDQETRTVYFDGQDEGERIKGAKALSGLIHSQFGVRRKEGREIAEQALDEFKRLQPGEVARVESILGKRKLVLTAAPYEVAWQVNMQDHFPSEIPVRCVVKIAYAFAGALLQDGIFHPEYEPVRRFLTVPESGVKVRGLMLETLWKDLAPVHGLISRVWNGRLYVAVVLFNCMGGIVELGPSLDVPGGQYFFDIKERVYGLPPLSAESERALVEALKEFDEE